MKPVTVIVNIFLGVIALMHLVRLIFQIEVTWAGSVVPLWISFFGCLFTAGLTVMLWRENRKGD
ncbi:MAG: hypothetical protein PHI06_07190 [Desulfobulbaceae bacterium]|nr:hypothetical protein [Desulfobulbaceae bacterium]